MGQKDTIAAVRCILDIWEWGGEGLLDTTLRIVSNAWPNEKRRTEWDVLKAVARFCQKYTGRYDERRLVTQLARKGITQIMAQGRMIAASEQISEWMGGSKSIQRAYDYGLTTNRLEAKAE